MNSCREHRKRKKPPDPPSLCNTGSDGSMLGLVGSGNETTCIFYYACAPVVMLSNSSFCYVLLLCSATLFLLTVPWLVKLACRTNWQINFDRQDHMFSIKVYYYYDLDKLSGVTGCYSLKRHIMFLYQELLLLYAGILKLHQNAAY